MDPILLGSAFDAQWKELKKSICSNEHIGATMSGHNDRRLQIGLLVFSAAILCGGLAYLSLRAKGTEEKESYLNVTITGKNGASRLLNYSELEGLPLTSGNAAFENRMGNWDESAAYEGVLLSRFVEEAGGMAPGDVLRVTSTDGYVQEYSYYNVYPDSDQRSIQGDLILALSMDGKRIPDWLEGPRTVFLPEDGKFSNEDAKYTSALGQGYFLNPSAGGRMARNVWRIDVLAGPTSGQEWVLALLGSQIKNLSRTEFGTLSFDARTNLTDSEGKAWSGIALWRLLALVDGGEMRGENSFNQSYADSGYEIRLMGERSVSLESNEVAGNDAIIVADSLNGQALIDLPALASSNWSLAGLAKAELLPLWVLEVQGTQSRSLYLGDLCALQQVRGRAGFLKTTGAIVGPYDLVGVPLLTVLQQAGDLPGNYSVEVTAVDGYAMMLTQAEVEGRVNTYDAQGQSTGIGSLTSILFYEQNGSRDFSGRPLRLAFLGQGDTITDSHYWVKEVAKLTVKMPVKDWSVMLSGISEYVLNRTTFESGATCVEHRTALNVTIKGETHLYEGLPLWIILSIVDGKDDPEGHFLFNDDLARNGYQVRVVASDGFAATVNSTMLWRNDEIVLAYLRDGSVLTDEWPLRLVGNGLTSKQMVKNIARIEMVIQ